MRAVAGAGAAEPGALHAEQAGGGAGAPARGRAMCALCPGGSGVSQAPPRALQRRLPAASQLCTHLMDYTEKVASKLARLRTHRTTPTGTLLERGLKRGWEVRVPASTPWLSRRTR